MRAPARSPTSRGAHPPRWVPVAPAPSLRCRMIARAYFQLVDAIAAVQTDDELAEIRSRVAATPMHPFEFRALERQVRARELALQVELEL